MERRILIFLLAVFTASLAAQTASGQKPSVYKVERMPFNTNDFSEIAPVITADGLVFCSDRRFSIIRDRLSFDGRRLYNIYRSGTTDSLTWTKPAEYTSDRNNLFNNGPFCFSSNGATVYFTSEIETGEPARKKSFVNHSGIFIAELSGTDIRSVQPFRYNSPDYDLGQPSLSSDGRYLLFSSNMPGGFGGSDLYYCENINGEWSQPTNLGPAVNTSASESFPGCHPSGRVYFSSDRQGGPGKMDIYYTSLNGDRWDEPVLLPEPVNSAEDDFSFTAAADLQTGYFASDRKNSDDIYRFTSTIIRKASCGEQEENSYCFRFIEENTSKFDTMPFRYDWNFGDGEKASGVLVEHCYKGPGTYIVQLDVINLVTKEISYNEKSDTLVITKIEQAYIAGTDSTVAGRMIDLNADESYLPGWNTPQYYWNFGDETVAVGSRPEKAFLKPGTYNVQLIVTAASQPGMPVQETCVSKNIRVFAGP